jgi:hypothetical protein
MKAKLKSMHSPDIDITSFSPSDPTNFCFLLQTMIGPDGEDGAESFDIQVCTPTWLMDRHAQGKSPNIILGIHMIIMFSYDINQLRTTLEKYCEQCVGDNWSSVANQLSKLGAWEFDHYH